MALSSSQLEAFSTVAKTRSFSAAARSLHVTQSALSQRISHLESELGTTLIVRDPAGLRLTAVGEELLRYCRVKERLEAEVLDRISTSQHATQGVVRIGAFSSVMRSVIMPSLSELLLARPNVNIELFTREIRELPKMLMNGEVDLIVTLAAPDRHDVVSHLLGHEVNVLVESASADKTRKHIYLDHDPDDETTQKFFALNRESGELQRNYLDEVYSIMDAVRLGWGRAVLPRHLVRDDSGLRIVRQFKPLKSAVFLRYIRQPYHPQLFLQVTEEILRVSPDWLAHRRSTR